MTIQPSVLAEAVRRCRGAFLLVGVFSFALNLLVLAAPLYMLQVYGRVLSSGRVETLIMLTMMLAAAVAAFAAIDVLRMGITVRVGLWLNQTLGPFYLDSVVRESSATCRRRAVCSEARSARTSPECKRTRPTRWWPRRRRSRTPTT